MSIPIQVSHLMYFIVSIFLSTSFYLWTLVCLFPDVVNSYCNHSYYNHNNCRWVYQMLHIKNVIWTNWYINSKEDPFILKKINVWIKPPQKNLFINSNCVSKKMICHLKVILKKSIWEMKGSFHFLNLYCWHGRR